jgi:hypothetical protein
MTCPGEDIIIKDTKALFGKKNTGKLAYGG